MTFVKHIAGPMENMVQRCVICGYVISDYRNAMWPMEQGPPQGFNPGEVYISKNTNPTQLLTAVDESKHQVEDCNN